MTIRISEFTTLDQFLWHNEDTAIEQAKILERLSTLKKVNRASDDPAHYRQIKDAKAEIEENMAFQDNIVNTRAKLRLTEDVFNTIRDAMEEAREVTIQGTSFIYDDLERETIGDELEQLRLTIFNQLNTQYEGEYLFAGTDTNTLPFPDPLTGAYAGNTDLMQVRVSKTDTVTTNFTGEEIAFGATGQGGAEDVLDILDDLITAFRNNDVTAVNVEVPRLRPALERINHLIGDVGNRQLRLENEESRHLSFETSLRSILADLQDADLAEETVNLERINAQFESQLRAQGSVNRQQSLLDFLG